MKKLLCVCMLLLMANCAAAETLYINGGTADRVHLRAAGSPEAASLGLYFSGAPVERRGQSAGGWSQVLVGTEMGFIRDEYLHHTQTRASPLYEVANATSDWVNLRRGASFDMAAIGRLDNGDQVRLMGETSSGWSYVETMDGVQGYVVTDFLRPVTAVETAAVPPASANTQIVGMAPNGDYIHTYLADNGQTLYFAAMEAEPGVLREDVNFDGVPDLLIETSRGNTNCWYEMFLMQGGRYVYVQHPGMDSGFANVQLYPAEGYLVSAANNGYAGAMYEDFLFAWEGAELRQLRRAVSDHRVDYSFEDEVIVRRMHERTMELSVHGYEDGETLLYSETIDLDEMNGDKLRQMKKALWTGL